MTIIILKRFDDEMAIPLGKIDSVIFFNDLKKIDVHVNGMGHSFYFESVQQAKNKFDEIIYLMRAF